MSIKRAWLGIALLFGISIAFTSCVTGRGITNSSTASQGTLSEAGIELYRPQPGTQVRELLVNRTGSLAFDLNNHEGGVWFRDHSNRIVNVSLEEGIEVTGIPIFRIHVSQRRFSEWRIEYVPLEN